MKFNIPSKALYNQASMVSRVINSKNAMTILNNFLFTIEGNTLTITASDVENTLSASIEVQDVEGSGSFCADAKKIVDLLKELPDQGISFDVNDTNFSSQIKSLNGDFNLIGVNGAEYPETVVETNPDETLAFEAPVAQIQAGLDNTLFAVGTDEIWPQMMGVYWGIKPESLTFVATDSRKLVKYNDATSRPGIEGSFILPAKACAILKNILVKGEEKLKVTLDSKSGTFVMGGARLNCRFIKGTYPDYERVIPKNNTNVITVDRLSFLNAVKRVAVFVEQGHGLIRFMLDQGQITIKAQDNNLCTSGVETLKCNYDGGKLLIGFGATHLVEIFSTIPTQDVELRLADSSRPGLFMPSENKADTELVMLLMPMMVNDF